MRPALLFLAVFLLSACSNYRGAHFGATDIFVTRPVPGVQTSAAYLTLTNNTNKTITITRVTSPDFASVEMHESRIEDGIARMHALTELSIQTSQTVRFERGGKHLMLTSPIADTDAVTLQFYSDDILLLSVIAAHEPAAD